MKKIAANRNYKLIKRSSQEEAKKTLGKMVGTVQNNVAHGLTEYGAPETGGYGLNYNFKVNLENLSSQTSVSGKENPELTEYVEDKFNSEKDKEENTLALKLLSNVFRSFNLPVTVMPPEYDSGDIEF